MSCVVNSILTGIEGAVGGVIVMWLWFAVFQRLRLPTEEYEKHALIGFIGGAVAHLVRCLV